MAKEGVAAVDRALSIVDAFTERDRSLTLTEISKRTGLYKSTTLRLAESLEKFAYLRRLEDGSYQIGPKPLLLAGLYQRHFRTADIVPKALRDMVEALGESASFYVRDGDRRVCLHRVDSPRAIRHAVQEGTTLPIAVGASGHVLLAFGGEPGELSESIREAFFSASSGERDPETAAIAAPVFGANQQLAGALTISGPKYRLEELPSDKVVSVLFKHARELTEAFGGRADAFPADPRARAGGAGTRLWGPRAVSSRRTAR